MCYCRVRAAPGHPWQDLGPCSRTWAGPAVLWGARRAPRSAREGGCLLGRACCGHSIHTDTVFGRDLSYLFVCNVSCGNTAPSPDQPGPGHSRNEAATVSLGTLCQDLTTLIATTLGLLKNCRITLVILDIFPSDATEGERVAVREL